MSDSTNPALQFAGPLKDLAEGRLDPQDWLAWWNAHAAEVEATCSRGWFLKLKPMQVDSGANRATLISQGGAHVILKALNVPFVPSDRYQLAWNNDFQNFRAEERARKELRSAQFEPRLFALAKVFPKFARFLKKRASDIDRLDEPASDADIASVERALGVILPEVYTRFLRCTKAISMDGLSIGLEQVLRHPARVGDQPPGKESICIADYDLEADGDQVLIELSLQPLDDPPVYYYAHTAGSNTARPLASEMTAWFESLPKSSVFRD